MKLHKLLYYCQAWHLVWDDEKLFDARIEAWRDGPVVPDVFRLHQSQYMIDEIPGTTDVADIEPNEIESIDIVLNAYGGLSASELSDRTHAESPWINARQGVPAGSRGGEEITDYAMHEYFHARYEQQG